ncbi:hypothetical protein [uncultured Cardiobacterium sp.]|uniref:hypothetical protein n=1 Tax=uncultured Cardiobacterium sp. TaxID=417619 RepID=UPI00261DA3E6|nr:hypothetical protein [uncultured Cardiobacterium sp.]
MIPYFGIMFAARVSSAFFVFSAKYRCIAYIYFGVWPEKYAGLDKAIVDVVKSRIKGLEVVEQFL